MANFNVELINGIFQVRLWSHDGSYGGIGFSYDYIYLWKNPSYYTQMCIAFKVPAGAENCKKLILYSDSNYFYNSSSSASYTVNQNSQVRYAYRLYDSSLYTNNYKSGTILKQGIYTLNLYSVSNNGNIPAGESASRKQVPSIKFELDVSDISLKQNDIYVFTVQYLDSNVSLTEFVFDIGYQNNSNWDLYFYQDNKVTYNSNGGNTINESINFDSSFTITNTIPTKNDLSSLSNFEITCSGGDSDIVVVCTKDDVTSFRFLGWNTDQHATTALYTTGQVVSNLSGDIILYAIWEQYNPGPVYSNNSVSSLPIPEKSKSTKAYSITLDANGGTARTDIIYCAINIFYTFKEWVDQNNRPINKSTQFTESATVYATWNEIHSGSINLPTATKEGCTFLGWSESKTGSDLVSNVYTPTKDCTLYAIYKSGYFIEGYIRLSNKWIKLE